MPQLTIRGIDDELHRALKDAAARNEVSMNRYLVRVLKDAVSPYQVDYQLDIKRGVKEYADLDHLAGTWGEEDADVFDGLLAEQRAVDEAMWP